MKWFLIVLLFGFGAASFESSAADQEGQGNDIVDLPAKKKLQCHPWQKAMVLQVKEYKICLGNAFCWPKIQCPAGDSFCIKHSGKWKNIICKANKDKQCPKPIQCLKTRSPNIEILNVVVERVTVEKVID